MLRSVYISNPVPFVLAYTQEGSPATHEQGYMLRLVLRDWWHRGVIDRETIIHTVTPDGKPFNRPASWYTDAYQHDPKWWALEEKPDEAGNHDQCDSLSEGLSGGESSPAGGDAGGGQDDHP